MAIFVILFPGALLLGGLLYFENKNHGKGVLPTKTALSSLFLITALIQPGPMRPYALLIAIGLAFCLAGDVLLALPHPRMFLMGLIIFLIGHLFYVMAFFHVADLNTWTTIGALLTLALSASAYCWLKPHLVSMHLPVVFYMIVISAMLCGAWSTWGMDTLRQQGRLLAISGALCFYLSDLLVARDRFLRRAFVNRLIGLPLYYTGQFMIAFSVGNISG
jgi:uncharacterized membrane protein YhhN